MVVEMTNEQAAPRAPLLTLNDLLPVEERGISDDDPYIEIEHPDTHEAMRYRVAEAVDLSPLDLGRVNAMGKQTLEWMKTTPQSAG